ncbi:hypothetical protein [Pseudomonas sp. RGM 3321]|uniref:hypothetical protein n=1 Tax=Pseudomonas sp. RGM 3321 TaxID=2930089 RepID=UPI001FCAED1D|nr:hypothetical protein [Pseudomonas sp. RGM 3321]MCJ2375161.1 hypothetical protein [Pseudomonas sp. RGM 3321]
MNEFRDLKAIAEACQQHQPLRFMRSHGALYIRNDSGIVFDVHQNRSFPDFMAQNKDYADLVLAANPAAVLELIADQKRMASRLLCCTKCGGQGEVYSGRTSYEGYNQPPEPIMDKCGECDGAGVLGDEEECLSILDELEQLKAENAGLKTGYEAYERVNAELTQRIANLELCQKASLGVSGIIRSAASELGFDAAGEDSALNHLIGLARAAAALRAECEALRNRQSFSDAFYEVSGLLGVTGARPEAPLVVFRQEVVPALQAVIRNSRRYEWLRDSAGSADWEFFGHQGKSSTDQNIDAAMGKEASQ